MWRKTHTKEMDETCVANATGDPRSVRSQTHEEAPQSARGRFCVGMVRKTTGALSGAILEPLGAAT